MESATSKKWTLFDPDIWKFFFKPGEVVEVRMPKVNGKSPAWGGAFVRGTVSGFFDDHGAFCKAIKLADQSTHAGIYFTLQRIDPRLLARSFNRLKLSEVTTSDRDCLAYRWVPVDLDPVRPSGIPSSNSELQAALELRDKVAEWMVENFKFPSPIRAISGNGGHLLFRLPDLPVTEENREFIRNLLVDLARRFNNDCVQIDTTVHNPARIWKVYGTTARKGDAIPTGPNREARPFRIAYIDELGGLE
jgi:hypothetical protein